MSDHGQNIPNMDGFTYPAQPVNFFSNNAYQTANYTSPARANHSENSSYVIHNIVESLCCAQCGQIFSNLTKLEAHASQARHQAFECLCNARYMKKSILKRHIKEATGPGFRCVCGQVFRRQQRLDEHRRRPRVHQSESHDIKRSTCDSAFASASPAAGGNTCSAASEQLYSGQIYQATSGISQVPMSSAYPSASSNPTAAGSFDFNDTQGAASAISILEALEERSPDVRQEANRLGPPIGQAGTHDIVPTDSGYGTSIRPGSQGPDVRNPKDTWNQPDPETAQTVQTDYSDIQMPQPRFNQYSWELVSCILEDLKETIQIGSIHDLVDSLPVLFKAFALRLAQTHHANPQRQSEVVYFVYRFREDITKMVEQRCHRDSEWESPPETPAAYDGIPASEKCENWLQNTNSSPNFDSLEEPDPAWIGVPDDEDNDLSVEDINEYHTLVRTSPAYSWLLECIRRNTSLNLRGAATVSSLADEIINALPAPPKLSPRRTILPLSMKFRVPWNPIEFLRNQGHQDQASHVISAIITLTGEVVDAQAATTEQYLNQTWPATGRHFLGAIVTALRAQERPNHGSQRDTITYVYPDQTRISIEFCGEVVEFDVIGSSYSIAEVGEQLGWLVSALQSSSSETSMSFCRPILRDMIEAPVTGTEALMVSNRYICTLECVVEPIDPSEQKQDGQCWHKLFINPVIVAGYPILSRPFLEPSRGLEAPFEILVALAETPVLTSFGQSTLMKGYSTMLIPVLETCNIIVWHFVFDEKEERLSFLDSKLSDVDSIHPIAVDNHATRHIVGWCTKAKSMTGSSHANYDIGHSGLPRARVHHTMKNVSLTATRAPIGGTLNFEISKKDKLLVCGFPKVYFRLISFLRRQHVVLYDVATRRAWLVDGQSAVLHLVRASLEKDLKSHGRDSEDFLYRSDQLHNASEELDGPDAAYAVLMNRRNRLLELSVDDVTYHEEWEEDPTSNPSSPPKRKKKYKETKTFFQDRVVEICTSLEKIVDHMNNRNDEDGINFVLRSPRKNLLGGFDFMDIASNEDSFPVREMPLEVFGVEEGWTTLTSSIHAITLFGKDFGELIHPCMLTGMHECDSCGFGTAIPHGRDYLVTRSSLVRTLLKEKGDATTNPWQLINGLFWQTPDVTFQSCACTLAEDTKGQGVKLEKRIQVLYRTKFPRLWNRGNFLKSIEPDGAMIFGHSFLPIMRTGKRGKEETLEIHGAESSRTTTRDDVSRSSVFTEASGRGDHTQSTGSTSLGSSTAPTTDESALFDDGGRLRTEAKGKEVHGLAPNLSNIPDRTSKKRPYDALSSVNGTTPTGPPKKRRIEDFFYRVRNQANSRSSRDSN